MPGETSWVHGHIRPVENAPYVALTQGSRSRTRVCEKPTERLYLGTVCGNPSCLRSSRFPIPSHSRSVLPHKYKAEAPGAPLWPTCSFISHRPPMGVEVVLLHPGNGERPQVGDTVTTHYVGTIASDGSTFGSSLVRGSPFITEIGVGKLIKGWDEGVLQLTRGARAILKVSPDYAYGARGFPPLIPPNAALEFEVELLEIKPSSKPSPESTDSD